MDFNERVKIQKNEEKRLVRNSVNELINALIGKSYVDSLDEQKINKSAIEDILNYYHFEYEDDNLQYENIEEQLDCAIRPHGLIKKHVKLEKGWYKNAVNPMLGKLKDSGSYVALLPGKTIGYHYYNFEKNKRIKINSKNVNNIDEDVICFYQPLPIRELSIKDILVFIKDHIGISDIIKYVVFLGIYSLLGLLVPCFSQWLYGDILKIGSTSLLTGLSIFILCFTICQLMFAAYKDLISTKVITKVNIALEAATIHRAFNLPVPFYMDYSSGELWSRISQIKQLCQFIVDGLGNTGLTAVFSLIYVAQIFTYSPAMASTSLIIILITVVTMIITTVIQIDITTQRLLIQSKESGLSYSIISGIQKIKLVGAERRILSKWISIYTKILKLKYNPPFWIKFQATISLAISLFGTIVLYYVALITDLSIANYYAFYAAYGMVSAAFTSLATIVANIANIKPILTMIEPILNIKPEFSDNKIMVKKLNGDIHVENVSFSYGADSPNVLENLSLDINQGEYIGIVGKTGCGKSTLLRLLLGFEKPQKGAIYYDKYDIAQVDLKSLRSNLGTVLQDEKLFNGDIFSNISISHPTMTKSDAWEVAKIACIVDDIKEMPMGMHTILSEKHAGLSGGQKQRLFIARALAGNPKILIFDEATSSLDNVSQKKVCESIDKLNCTRIVIAHRLSTIKNCDKIFVIDNGTVVEKGNYNELINKDAYFAELVKRQLIDF